LCQVAVTLTCAAPAGHALAGRFCTCPPAGLPTGSAANWRWYTGTISYYLCWSPRPVPLARLIAVAVTRGKIEEDHQLPEQAAGLDSDQVTTLTSGHRRTAISLLACVFLAVAAAWQRARDGSTAALGPIPVTMPELLRQLRGTISPRASPRLAAPRHLAARATPLPVPRPAIPPAVNAYADELP
jgi:hypothetical protein